MTKNKKPRVFCAMSGGVDSSVTAALLKQCGQNVTGVFMKIGEEIEGLAEEKLAVNSCWSAERRDAMRAAARLGIPFITFDFEKEYKRDVLDYFFREYKLGKTPNPDVMCNRRIKFGIFLKKAIDLGADYVATGHYIRKRDPKNPHTSELSEKKKFGSFGWNSDSSYRLYIAKDKNKDQSYFLWTLTQQQLKYCLFPIGDYTKPEVRKMARDIGLSVAEKPESMGICFIGEVKVRDYLMTRMKGKPGNIVTTDGKIIGRHEGLPFYTVGQRRGLGIGGGIPYYVAGKDLLKNRLIVSRGARGRGLYSKELIARDAHWISGAAPKFPLRCRARIRHRQPLQEARVEKYGARQVKVLFKKPQRAIARGQSVVFYWRSEVLGGGIIKI